MNVYKVLEAWSEDTITGATRPASKPVVHDHYLERREGSEVIPVQEMIVEWLDEPATEHGIRVTNWDYYDMIKHMQIYSHESSVPSGAMLWFSEVEHEVDIDLRINRSDFKGGDLFDLTMLTSNYRDEDASGQFWLMLDVYGMYFFYPTWDDIPDFVLKTFPANYLSVESLMKFVWPENAGAGTGVKFWVAFVDDATGDVVYDFVEFGWS